MLLVFLLLIGFVWILGVVAGKVLVLFGDKAGMVVVLFGLF